MATTTIDTDTELSAVNSILGAIGQSPSTATSLDFTNPEIQYIYNILTEVNKDVQNEGWHFNTELNMPIEPDTNDELILPSNTLRYTLNNASNDKRYDFVVRGNKLYDLVDHTDKFPTVNKVYLDLVTLYKFEDIPSPYKRYIIYRSAVRAAAQLVSNPSLVQMLTQDEAKSRANCMEYEVDMSNPSLLEIPEGSMYKSYSPFTVLNR